MALLESVTLNPPAAAPASFAMVAFDDDGYGVFGQVQEASPQMTGVAEYLEYNDLEWRK